MAKLLIVFALIGGLIAPTIGIPEHRKAPGHSHHKPLQRPASGRR